MAGNRYSKEVKSKVERLRKAGKTYTQIREQFPIPKSTLSVWLGEKYKGIFDRKAQLLHLAKTRVLASNALRNRRIERERVISERVSREVLDIPLSDIGVRKALISMLYWAEGGKTKSSLLTFTNTNPRLAYLYITLLRRCFLIKEDKFRVRLHLHYYHKKKESVTYWSNLLDIPPSQFGKLYVKKRSSKKRFRKNFMGICFITYLDIGLRKEVLGLGYAIYDRVAKSQQKPSSFNG